MLVLGLDAADSTLIEKWSDEGILPTLRFLRTKGACVSLTHDRPIPSASVWPSIYTGTYAGKHGIYNSLQIEPGKQELDLVKPNQCAQPPLWRILDENSKSSIIMDVPFNYPLRDFNGIQILDWGSYERHYESHSLPSEILNEISKRFGPYPFGQEMSRDAPSSVRHFARARGQLLAGPTLKGNVVRWLISNRSWDFLMAVFSETHPAGHYFWGFHSNGHRDAVSTSLPELTTTLKDVYRAIDREIGKILEDLDEKITLVVLSGQGIGPNTAKWHVIPQVLSRLGLLATKNHGQSRARTNWLADFRDSIPPKWRRSVSAIFRDA
jgi:predicted AlkP superfamily phosphohydrolase/phosphomutase